MARPVHIRGDVPQHYVPVYIKLVKESSDVFIFGDDLKPTENKPPVGTKNNNPLWLTGGATGGR